MRGIVSVRNLWGPKHDTPPSDPGLFLERKANNNDRL